jgi:hypothetical protein
MGSVINVYHTDMSDRGNEYIDDGAFHCKETPEDVLRVLVGRFPISGFLSLSSGTNGLAFNQGYMGYDNPMVGIGEYPTHTDETKNGLRVREDIVGKLADIKFPSRLRELSRVPRGVERKFVKDAIVHVFGTEFEGRADYLRRQGHPEMPSNYLGARMHGHREQPFESKVEDALRLARFLTITEVDIKGLMKITGWKIPKKQ